MNSKEFSHKLFKSITIIYDGKGNVYSIGNQLAEKLGCSRDFILESVPEEFILFFEDEIKKFVPEKYSNSDTIILKEPGTHILIASSGSPFAKKLSVWLFSRPVYGEQNNNIISLNWVKNKNGFSKERSQR